MTTSSRSRVTWPSHLTRAPPTGGGTNPKTGSLLGCSGARSQVTSVNKKFWREHEDRLGQDFHWSLRLSLQSHSRNDLHPGHGPPARPGGALGRCHVHPLLGCSP